IDLVLYGIEKSDRFSVFGWVCFDEDAGFFAFFRNFSMEVGFKGLLVDTKRWEHHVEVVQEDCNVDTIQSSHIICYTAANWNLTTVMECDGQRLKKKVSFLIPRARPGIVLSPDHSMILVKKNLSLVHLDTSVQITLDIQVYKCVFSHDSRFLAILASESRLILFDCSSNAITWSQPAYATYDLTFTFSPNNHFLVGYYFNDRVLVFWDVSNGRVLQRYPVVQGQRPHDCCVSNDGSLWAFKAAFTPSKFAVIAIND
ncbi:MAG: hypothetical protein MI748_03475, partial [Opitutales bacterium]|nr:hypothetical protein [Opitutales bacterium]